MAMTTLTTRFISVYEVHFFLPADARPMLFNVVSSSDSGAGRGKTFDHKEGGAHSKLYWATL